ncbi:hypothetical protein BBJ28_00002782 [Nothophytophthora sp. Chile5]|nr:hypothetical protein BBJ28_00002782 [Nothophytophthora sp. Chile5]
MAVEQPAPVGRTTKTPASKTASPVPQTAKSVTDTSSSGSSTDKEEEKSSKPVKADKKEEKSNKPVKTVSKADKKQAAPAKDEGRRSQRVESLGADRSSRAHYKEGIRLAEMGKWSTLIERVGSEPQLARHKDHHGMLPLHWACTEDDAPTKVVRALLAAFPEAVITKNNAQYLPIHIAVKARASLETLKLLVDARPSSLMEETPSGKTVIQLAQELQLPAAAMQMLQRAEQDYLDLSEDDDEAFDYEDVKREIALQSQRLRESMLHPPSMAGPNASLPTTAPIGAVTGSSFGETGAPSSVFESQGMITSLSFVDGALVQSQSLSSSALVQSQSMSSNALVQSQSVSSNALVPRKDEVKSALKVSDTLGKSSVPSPVPTQTRAPPTMGPGRSKSSGPALLSTGFDDTSYGRAIYEPEHSAGVCGVCYKKFSMFRKKYQCKGCFTYLCKKHVAGKLELPNFYKKRSVCGDCYRIYRNGPMPNTMPGPANTGGSRGARVSGSIVSGAGKNEKGAPSQRGAAPMPPPSSSASTMLETSEIMNSHGSMMFSGSSRTSSMAGSRFNGPRPTRAESTHSMIGRPSNVPGPQMNVRYSTNTAGARPSRVPSGGHTRGSNTVISDTTVSLTDSDHQSAEVSVLQHRVATLEECNKILMTRVADQEKQYNEAMLLLTTTMTRVAEMEIRLPTDQRKSYRGTGGSTTASERMSELDADIKFSFPTPFVEKYD